MQQQLSNNLLTLGCIDEKVSMLHLSMQEKKKQTLLTHSNSILSSSSLSGSFPAALICLKKSIIDNVNPLTLSSDQYATSPNNIYTLSSTQVMRILKLIR